MKLFIRNIALFLIGFIAFVVVPILFVSSYDNSDKNTSENHNIISLQTKSSYDNLDILFVGNSYCYSSINTHILDSLNIHSFNLGIATAGVQFYDLILNDYFENIKTPPKKVLILVSPLTFTSKADNFNAYPIHRYLESEKSNLDISIKYNRLTELVSMYMKSTEKGLINLLFKRGLDQNKERSNNKGFMASDIVVSPKIISKDEHLYLALKNESLEAAKVSNLLEIAESIREKGSEVIFFELPVNILHEYFSKYFLADYEKALLKIKKDYRLLSINPDLFTSENYRNIDHMNSTGALIATKEILRLIEAN